MQLINTVCKNSKLMLNAQMLRCMKITAFILLAFCIHVSATTLAQNVTLSEHRAPLEKVIKEIKQQTGYSFFYNQEWLQRAQPVDIQAKNIPLEEALKICFDRQPYSYAIVNKTIVLKLKETQVQQQEVLPVVVPAPVHGKVVDEKGLPLPGVSVFIKGSKNGVSTATDGTFTIQAPDNATLTLSMIGYDSKEIKIDGKTDITITLLPSPKSLDEMIVVGYGAQKKASLTAAVTTINTSGMADIPASNLSNMLAGRASGVTVQTPTGLPGTTSNIRIRASSSWNGGTPLFVIDGVVRDQQSFDAIPATQIESISILKDAASAAIYGSRSSNGVLLVTTKTGKKGAPQVDLNSSVVLHSKPEINLKYLSLDQGMDIYNQLHTTNLINDFDRNWIHTNNPDGKMYYDALYQNPFSQRHNLNIAGGSDNVTYFVGGSFFDEKGFLPHLTDNSYNIRSNVQVAITKDLIAGVNISTGNNTTNRFYSNLASDADLAGYYEKLFYLGGGFQPPFIDGKPVYPGWAGGDPAATIRDGGYNNVSNRNTDALLSLEYKAPFIKGLSAKVAYSNNADNIFKKSFATKPTLYDFQKDSRSGIGLIYTDTITGSQATGFPSQPLIGNENTKFSSYQLNGSVNYDHNFGKHHINAFFGYEQFESRTNYSSIYKYNFPVYTTDQLGFASQDPGDTKATGYELQDARLSYIGRFNYDYDGRYLLSASARRDGSIKFAPNQRWGTFPSVSAGWVLSKENFFKDAQSLQFIDLLKLRYSYGSTGNDAIGGWLWQELYNVSNTGFYLGSPGSITSLLAYGGISNPNLTWETSTAHNLGLDVNFFRNWSFTAEVWKKHSYNILGTRILALPIEFGASFPAVNYGIVDAKGLELDLGFTNGRIAKDLTFGFKANLGIATTNVVKKDYAANALDADNPNGKPLDYLPGYQATGVIKTQQQLDALPAGYTIFGAKPELGMENFKDVSGPNGKPDGKIDEYDRVVISKYQSAATAPVSFGFNFNIRYKAFTLNALFSGVAGDKLLYNDPFGRSYSNSIDVPAYFANAWTPGNPNSNVPKIFPNGDARAQGYTVPSTYNTYNGAFVRLKNASLSYDLPQSVLSHIGIKSFQVFVGGTNLFILTKFKYYDPEVYSSASYPAITAITTGVNIKF